MTDQQKTQEGPRRRLTKLAWLAQRLRLTEQEAQKEAIHLRYRLQKMIDDPEDKGILVVVRPSGKNTRVYLTAKEIGK